MTDFEAVKNLLSIAASMFLFGGMLVMYSVVVHFEDKWKEKHGKYAKKH